MNPASATVHHPMKMRGLDRVREGKLNESSDDRGQPARDWHGGGEPPGRRSGGPLHGANNTPLAGAGQAGHVLHTGPCWKGFEAIPPHRVMPGAMGTAIASICYSTLDSSPVTAVNSVSLSMNGRNALMPRRHLQYPCGRYKHGVVIDGWDIMASTLTRPAMSAGFQ